MLKRKMKQNLKENRNTYITVGLLVGAGFLIGVKFQKKIDLKKLQGATVLVRELNPMFPDAMSLADIKEVLTKIDGAEFFDAIVTNVNGVQQLIIR